ncbi:MAG: hypothetical protein HYS69_04380 [candidate division NC10 bacterium]|nr:hypothetical protein [candidate division NC10 bacterium]
MVHWYFDEVRLVERMRETQRAADRAQALGLAARARPRGWPRFRARLGRTLVALGKRLQQTEPIHPPEFASRCDRTASSPSPSGTS